MSEEMTETQKKLFNERFFEEEDYNKIYSKAADYDNEDHTSWEKAKAALAEDICGCPKHDIFNSVADMSGKKVCSINPEKSTSPQNNQPGSPYHEAANLTGTRMIENIVSSDLYIVAARMAECDTQEYVDINNDGFPEVQLDWNGNDVTKGLVMRASDVKELFEELPNFEDTAVVFECPEDVANEETPVPYIEVTKEFRDQYQIEDLYSFFDID